MASTGDISGLREQIKANAVRMFTRVVDEFRNFSHLNRARPEQDAFDVIVIHHEDHSCHAILRRKWDEKEKYLAKGEAQGSVHAAPGQLLDVLGYRLYVRISDDHNEDGVETCDTYWVDDSTF